MKRSFSATEFLKQAMEFEEESKLSQVPQTQKEVTQPKEERRVLTKKQEPAKEEIPPKADTLKIDKNFYKVPNAVDDFIVPTLSATEEVIYRRLIRMSWGWGKNYCRAGIKCFQEATSIKSRTTIKTAIDGLIDKKIIYRYVDRLGRADRNQNGTVYIIPIPSIPDTGILKNGILNIGVPNIGVPKNDTASVSDIGIPENDVPEEKLIKTRGRDGIPKNGIPKNDPIKDNNKDNLKDTLSPRAIYTSFYNSIGQKRLSQEKRERAGKIIEELQKEGFSLDDIHFVSEWSVENAIEDLYDFSIIKHTIGQAMAAKEEAETKEVKRAEVERIAEQKRSEEEAEERKREEIEEYKENMDPKARARLRNRALKEIRGTDGIKEDFINDMLIAVKENEILRSKIDRS